MIKLYYSANSLSSRNAEDWLKKNNLNYKQINLNSNDSISRDELVHILSLTDLGTDEIIYKSNEAYKSLEIDLDNLTLFEILDLIIQDHSLLRRPIIIDDTHILVGFNKESIRKFIPKKLRIAKKEIFIERIHDIYEENGLKEDSH